ncbi:MAG TPA: CsbD family protein [Gammaproteobacteria bacterium]|nr:CsbD family protein [Gammaproteobacteria bacterium]
MNKDIVKGHWKEIKGFLKQQWGKLTDDEIQQMKGTYEELEGCLQKKYGYEKDRAEKEIHRFLDSNNIH